MIRHVRHYRWDPFRHLVQTGTANRIAGIAHQEVTGELVVIDPDDRARFAHPGINGKRHLIVVAPRNILHRTAGFPGKINKTAPAGVPFHQGKTPLDRLAFQTRHGEGPALGAVGVCYHVHAIQPLGNDFIAVVIGGGLGLIEVETGRKNSLVAGLRHLTQRVLPLPGLDQNAFR